MKKLILFLSVSLISLLSVQGQVQTIVVNASAVQTNGEYFGGVLTIDSGSFATLKSITGPGQLQINAQGATTSYSVLGMSAPVFIPLVVAGPATIQVLQPNNYNPANYAAIATFSVEPGPFPANKTTSLGPYSGNVQVTMEESTDLVNWTPAINGQTHTNSPDARFFRIKMVKNAAPAP